MLDVNPDVPNFSVEELDAELEKCETQADMDAWAAPMDEVFESPSIMRTVFLWQISFGAEESEGEDTAKSWEAKSDWRVLPAHWQTLLNKRLAEYKTQVQDAEAFYKFRLDTFGESDKKTKNALNKFTAIQQGQGAASVVLMMKGSGKEASEEVYRRCCSVENGTCKVSPSSKVEAYRLNVSDMSLEKLGTEGSPEVRHLRVISVTGKSANVQEIRIHLSSLSLNSSGAINQVDDKNRTEEEKKRGKMKGHEQGLECIGVGESLNFP